MLKKKSGLGRVENDWFEIEGLDFAFQRSKDGYVCKIKILIHGFDRLQILVHRQNRRKFGRVAIGGRKTALSFGLSQICRWSFEIAHFAFATFPFRPAVVAATMGIDTKPVGLLGRFRAMTDRNRKESTMAQKERN